MTKFVYAFIIACKTKNMSIEQSRMLYNNMNTPTIDDKMISWECMGTGIYYEQGNLIDDRFKGEEIY